MRVAIILARAGSKGIKNKNIVEVAGKPLIHFMLTSLLESRLFDEVYVSTDDDDIANVARELDEKIKIFERSPINSNDDSTSDAALVEFLLHERFEPSTTVVMAQLTSPLTSAADIQGAISHFEKSQAESVISVVRQKRFLWTVDGKPINYDVQSRPRRQDFDGILVENGALYISRVASILTTKMRISGKIEVYEMPEYTYIEVDEPSDLLQVEALLSSQLSKD